MSRSALSVAVLLFALTSCSETASNGSRNAAPPDRSARGTDTGGEKTNAEIEAEIKRIEGANRTNAPLRSLGDARVMFFEPKNNNLLIVVNESNSLRKSDAGRRTLAAGDPNRPYKILTDQQMSALLVSMENNGLKASESPLEAGDEQYYAEGAQSLPRYKGVIVVEQGGRRTKVLGFRPATPSDPMGVEKLKTFTNLKGFVIHWYDGTSMSEMPQGAVTLPATPARRS